MLQAADFLAAQYAEVIDRSLLLTGTLLHDFAKCEEFTTSQLGLVTDYSLRGQLLGHPVLGAQAVARCAEKLGTPEEKAALLEHMRTAKAFANEELEEEKFHASNETFKTSKRMFHKEMGIFMTCRIGAAPRCSCLKNACASCRPATNEMRSPACSRNCPEGIVMSSSPRSTAQISTRARTRPGSSASVLPAIGQSGGSSNFKSSTRPFEKVSVLMAEGMRSVRAISVAQVSSGLTTRLSPRSSVMRGSSPMRNFHRSISLFLCLALALCLLPAEAGAAGLSAFTDSKTYAAGQFTDVAQSAWYAPSVAAVCRRGVMVYLFP